MKTTTVTERELALALMLLQDDGRANLTERHLAIVEAYENDSVSILRDRPSDRSESLNYVGGGYAIDSRGNYREAIAFYAGCP